MSILIPIVNELLVTVEVTFAGSTDFAEIDAEVLLLNGASFAGGTSLTVAAQLGQESGASFSGGTAFTADGRLNDEANVFGAASFDGATTFTPEISVRRLVSATFAGATTLQATLNSEVAPDFGFTVFVDILDTDLSDALENVHNIRRFNARLLIDGDEVPIIRAVLTSPEDKLGTELQVTLAQPNVSLVTLTSVITFQIGIWVGDSGGSWTWITLLEGGKLAARGARYANDNNLPADTVELTIVDVMGDRWNRAPRNNVFLYDPQKVEAPSSEALQSQTIYELSGAAIAPTLVPHFSMTLYDILNEAYVNGCEFDAVVTNIPDFLVEQASFTMTGGYDGGVRPLLEPFVPITFVIENTLWIIDPDQPLPAGLTAIDFVAAFSLDIQDTLPGREPINAIILRLNNSQQFGDFVTERLESTTTSSGVFGTPSYVTSDVEKRIKEYRNASNPAVILSEEVTYVKTRTLDFEFNELSIETRNDTFDSLNRRTGYTQTIEALVPQIADGAMVMQELQTETQQIFYTPDPVDPRAFIQDRIVTMVAGLILVDPATQYLEQNYEIPYLDAHKSGYIVPGGDQTTRFGEIRTTTEQMRYNGGQVQYETRVVNHVAGVSDRLTTKTLPGSNRIDRGSQGTLASHAILLTVPGTEATARRVRELDGTQLPYEVALQLGQRMLNNLNNPPRELSINMSFLNPSVRKGSPIHVAGRSGYLGTYIVKGTTITFTAVDMSSYKVTMSLTARELHS